MVNGTLISFEGPEGAGKSSVLEAVLPLHASPCSWENRLDGPLY